MKTLNRGEYIIHDKMLWEYLQRKSQKSQMTDIFVIFQKAGVTGRKTEYVLIRQKPNINRTKD